MSEAKLFSDDPADLLAMADEIVDRLKRELLIFDARQAPTYEMLRARADLARDDGDGERSAHFAREADRHLARWQDARRPMLLELQRILMARHGFMPQTLTFTQATELKASTSDIPWDSPVPAA